MKTWSFYDPATGLFSSRSFTGGAVELNTPQGLVAIEGHYDELSQRVDLASGEVVDWQPPKPDDDHEWNNERRRWALKREVAERRSKRRRILAQMEDLERRQYRPIRELAINPDNTEARDRLAAIEAEIERLRGDLTEAR